MPPQSHFFHPYSFCLFLVCVHPPVCALVLPHKICLLDQLLPNPPTSFFSSHACGFNFSNFLLPLFFLLVCWHAVCFFSSPSLIHLLLYMFKVIVLGKHGVYSLIFSMGRLVRCPVFFNSKQFSSLPRGSIESWMPIVRSASEKLVQRFLVLLWRILQHGVVSPLLWTWTWGTQQRSGHNWHYGYWMYSVVECGYIVTCTKVGKNVCESSNHGSVVLGWHGVHKDDIQVIDVCHKHILHVVEQLHQEVCKFASAAKQNTSWAEQSSSVGCRWSTLLQTFWIAGWLVHVDWTPWQCPHIWPLLVAVQGGRWVEMRHVLSSRIDLNSELQARVWSRDGAGGEHSAWWMK